MHHLRVTHETPYSRLCVEPAGLGARCIVHFAPFQCSMSTWSSADPTAMQSVDDEHETAFRELNKRDLSGGVRVISQRLPRQTSARVVHRFDVSTSAPTALQNVRFTHDTPSRWLSSVWAGAGVGCCLQALPFHEAASGSWASAEEL